MDFWGDEQFSFFESILFLALGQTVEVIGTQFLSGGDISTAAQVFTSEGVFFIKWNHARPNESDAIDMFEAEARGLDLLRQTDALYIPQVVGFGQQLDKSYLILDYIDPGQPDHRYWETLGQSLAILHSHTQATFGLSFSNYIGSLQQTNTPTTSGIDFFFEHRLLPQAGMALYKGLLTKTTYEALFRLRNRLPDILPHERPALLHGDLWSGNVMVTEQGQPALIDPAVYYGFREADLAHTRLFGGFDQRFYDAYDEAFPLHDGFDERVAIYNLYPLLVHVNLFGSGYVSGVERVLKRF
ncbi:fructosamine kinase family protein [Spirosoma utsteinense]|uniref:Fructosamine-3-kinase n=1 Tax=Spirosoma utsteinense TaxID=2585773 RepID=A0ABR6W665_9BACT|nr:fructosamine kinase family protein [Spirosoma utsteinense]MBC3785485.1 fructosamine-3-kinase [Spirosoma utsteinense]MBC3791486.1 fructosamine-3-kinase [Spirosoma utsteinense]